MTPQSTEAQQAGPHIEVPSPLTEQEVNSYLEDGYLVAPGLLDSTTPRRRTAAWPSSWVATRAAPCRTSR